MSDTAFAIILGFAFLSVKHAIADYALQTPYQVFNKGKYGHPGGLLHAGIHIVLTAPVFLLLPPSSAGLGLAILAGEFLVHYHCDWLKERVNKRYGLQTDTAGFWHAFGADQLVHSLTYVVIIYLLVR
jgi:hypothetical protein